MLRSRSILSTLVLTVGVAAVLAGCTPTPEADPTTGPSASAAPTSSASPAPSDTAAPADPVTSTPIGAGCADLVSADALYAYNPNFAAIDAFTPAGGSAAATAVSEKGVACEWQNLSSRETIVLSVASLDEGSIVRLKAVAAASSGPGTTPGDESYFSVEGGVGTATVFKDSYWMVVTSPVFLGADDAAEIVDSALAALH